MAFSWQLLKNVKYIYIIEFNKIFKILNHLVQDNFYLTLVLKP